MVVDPSGGQVFAQAQAKPAEAPARAATFGGRQPLFSTFDLGRLRLRNRIVMAPMTREQAPGGVPTEAMARYYARRAAAGVALILTEGTPPDAAGQFGAQVPRFFGDDALRGWQTVVDAVHAHGAAIFPQLWHVGAFSPSMIGKLETMDPSTVRVSPSGLAAPGRPFGQAMSQASIDATLEAFAQAARAARDTGFDGVEVHGAHGYLPDQFLWAGTNVRDDGYGGDVAGRVRFACELVKAIKSRAGCDFPVSFRISQWKQLDYAARLARTPAELAAIVQPLARAGVDLFHCSTRRFWEPEFSADPRTFAAWVRELSGVPTITVGSVTLGTDFKAPTGKVHAAVAADHLEMLAAGLEAGHFDLVAIGRALLSNPDWVDLVRSGRAHELVPFDRSALASLA
ncbi:MAG: 12-oxophytodienoate reductase [Rubrivivax sp.]